MTLLRNVLTFGAAGRVERKIEEFEDVKEEYDQLYETMEFKRVEVNEKLEDLIQLKLKCVTSLKRITQISKSLQGKDRDVPTTGMLESGEIIEI